MLVFENQKINICHPPMTAMSPVKNQPSLSTTALEWGRSCQYPFMIEYLERTSQLKIGESTLSQAIHQVPHEEEYVRPFQ